MISLNAIYFHQIIKLNSNTLIITYGENHQLLVLNVILLYTVTVKYYIKIIKIKIYDYLVF